ncbi:hypothetical protein [Echinicola arenosa]|nr:hypothetical protein [Echinicola arenosa]
MLNRKRPFTVENVRILSSYSNLPVEVLVQPYELDGKQEKMSV